MQDKTAIIADLIASIEWARIAEEEARLAGNATAAAYHGGRRSGLREAIRSLRCDAVTE